MTDGDAADGDAAVAMTDVWSDSAADTGDANLPGAEAAAKPEIDAAKMAGPLLAGYYADAPALGVKSRARAPRRW